LSFDGVKIDNVEVEKLHTFFELHDYSINQAVDIGKLEQGVYVDVSVRKYRINHKPFTYKIDFTSDKDAHAYVRVYLAPKYNYLGREFELDERRKYVVEIDQFPYHMKAGKNVIERNSHDSSVVTREEESYRKQYYRINDV
ncbi:hypothetical protein L9F63_008526, partial [Diploptera punctata]